jgi:hypothetical protein
VNLVEWMVAVTVTEYTILSSSMYTKYYALSFIPSLEEPSDLLLEIILR